MWVLMTLVMMSTTAVPVLRSLRSVTTNTTQLIWWAFVFGYAIIWFGFALAASSLQLAISELNLFDEHSGLNTSLSAGLLIAAGLYQFSSLKQRCLSECLAPMQFFCAIGTMESVADCKWVCVTASPVSGVVVL